jgi:sucrose-6-phosphatase
MGKYFVEDGIRDQVALIASHYADLELQPPSEQNPFKVSYYLSEQVAHNVIPNFKAELAQHGVNVKIVYSGSHDLDLLPKKGIKG